MVASTHTYRCQSRIFFSSIENGCLFMFKIICSSNNSPERRKQYPLEKSRKISRKESRSLLNFQSLLAIFKANKGLEVLLFPQS